MVYEIIPTTDPRLGRNINHDPRSRAFAFRAPVSIELKSVRHERLIPVLDQGSLGSCTGNTGIGAMGTNPYYPTVKELAGALDEAAAVTLYSAATAIDPWPGSYPPEDTGSDGLSIAKVLHGRGWISGYRHTFTLEDMKAALQENPVMLGINWYTSFYSPDAEGNITIKSGASVAGGHEIIVDEIDMEKQRFGLTNSWGEGWGLNGRFFISFSLMQRLLDERGDVVVLVPNTMPAPTPDPDVNVDPEPNPDPTPPSPGNPGCLTALLGPLVNLFKRA